MQCRIRCTILPTTTDNPVEPRKTRNRSIVLSEKQQARFWSFVRKTDTCWFWEGLRDVDGYGRIFTHGAHRISYTLIKGPIPDGMTLDHLRESGVCSSKLCINPDHLEPVTGSVNVGRYQASKAIQGPTTTCSKGHERVIGRPCKGCRLINNKLYAERHPEKRRETMRNQKRRERALRREVAA